MAEGLQGGCLCGGVQFEIAQAAMMAHCHCQRCRQWGGGSYATVVAAPSEGFKLVSGQELLKTYAEEGFAKRSFCSRCGSSLYCDGGDSKYVLAGAIKGDPSLRPGVHVNVSFKAPWHEIRDELPQFPEFPPEG